MVLRLARRLNEPISTPKTYKITCSHISRSRIQRRVVGTRLARMAANTTNRWMLLTKRRALFTKFAWRYRQRWTAGGGADAEGEALAATEAPTAFAIWSGGVTPAQALS